MAAFGLARRAAAQVPAASRPQPAGAATTPTAADAEPFVGPARFDAHFRHDTATVAGVRLHYVRGGAGPAVVLLHGFPETWYTWRLVMPALAAGYTVVAVDYRGAGASGIPDSGYDLRTMAGDIRALAARLGLGRVHLVGHDVGGMIAYRLAADAPDRVRSLTIVDVPLHGTSAWPMAAAGAWWFSFHQVAALPEALTAGREAGYLDWFYTHQGATPTAIAPAAKVEYVRAYARPGGMRAAFDVYRAFPADSQQNAASLRRKLATPVLALGGERSAGPFLVGMMREAAADVRGRPVPGAGHWVQEENPADLTRQLLAFLAAAPSGPLR